MARGAAGRRPHRMRVAGGHSHDLARSFRARVIAGPRAAHPRPDPSLPDAGVHAHAGVLSPHRGRQGEMKAHEGTAPRRPTSCGVPTACGCSRQPSRQSYAECVGWRVLGSRFAALEPIAQGLGRPSVEADVARGLALRMDHGSQICRTTFLNQLPTGASTPASASSARSSSAGIARSRSKPSTAGSFETSPRCARPSLRSSNATTSAGASRSWRIARRSKRAELRHAA